MLDFLFGGKRKLELIRELVEQRMREIGFDDMEYRLHVKQLKNMELMSTPEATVVTIVETIIKLQKRGLLLRPILDSTENHRKSMGHDPKVFRDLLDMASGTSPGEVVHLYLTYRINLEAPGRMTAEQLLNAFATATQVLTRS